MTGKLIEKYETVQRSGTFKTREFVVEKVEDAGGRSFTTYVKFQCVQDRTTIVDAVNIGDNIKVHFNIRGSKWEKEGRVNYITNLDAWRVESLLGTSPAPQPKEDFTNMTLRSDDSPADDLPF